MKDEEYVFVSDVRDKKITARSARNKRTRNGKRGRVKLPSDYLTKKELKAMNSDVKSYRLNDPMKWKEFKSMPDDLKITYIKLIRERYNPFDFAIAEMMGVHRVTFANEMKRLNLGVGKLNGGKRDWDMTEWLKWSTGIPTAEEKEEEPTPEVEDFPVERCEAIPEEAIIRKAIPCSGNMTFNGAAEAALKTVLDLLGGANVHLNITWEMLDE